MLMSTESSKSSTKSAITTKNNHHFNKFFPTHFPLQIPTSTAVNRSINETTCTTVTNIPCHQMKQKHAPRKTKVHSIEKDKKHHHHTVPTSFLHQSIPFEENSSNLSNIFRSLSFHNVSSNIQNDLPIISDDYQINTNTNNEQFQFLKKQFHTYLNDIQFNCLSRVIHLLSLCHQLNDEQIKDFLQNIGYSDITIDHINRFTTNDRRISINETFKNLRTTLNDYKKVRD